MGHFMLREKFTRIQDYPGRLNFATDAWTALSHKAFVAVTVHLEQKGKPLCLVLDIVEVVMVHTYQNLTHPFTNEKV